MIDNIDLSEEQLGLIEDTSSEGIMLMFITKINEIIDTINKQEA